MRKFLLILSLGILGIWLAWPNAEHVMENAFLGISTPDALTKADHGKVANDQILQSSSTSKRDHNTFQEEIASSRYYPGAKIIAFDQIKRKSGVLEKKFLVQDEDTGRFVSLIQIFKSNSSQLPLNEYAAIADQLLVTVDADENLDSLKTKLKETNVIDVKQLNESSFLLSFPLDRHDPHMIEKNLKYMREKFPEIAFEPNYVRTLN